MKKNLHKINGKQLREIVLISNRFGQIVALQAESGLDVGLTDKKRLYADSSNRIQIKLPREVLWKLLRTCNLTIQKKRTWWWVDEIVPEQ